MALLKLLLLLLGLGVAVNSDSVSLQKRIIGGHDCLDNERHYHVKITGRKGNVEYFCGGSLISDQWILTAAHCWKSGWTIEAHLGVHPKNAPKETQTITEHKIYRGTSNLAHDIMLLKLPTTTTIPPIELIDCPTSLQVGTMVQIAGFGPAITGPNNERIDHEPSALQCADIKIAKREEMTASSSIFFRYRYQHWSCAKSSTKDTSGGDSGGGWVYQDKLYGVHAFTGDGDYACSEPAGFMEVCAYRDWIKKITKP